MTTPIEPNPRRARLRVGVGAAIVVLLVALGSAVFVTAITPRGEATTVVPGDGSSGSGPNTTAGDADTDSPTAPAADGQQASAVFVHVLGSVQRPGLYELGDGARAVDAVAAAGGFTDTADPCGVNLARFVADGEQLYVPAVGEVAQPPTAGGAEVPGKVNVNTADLAELDTLPRVGPAMAERIIQWREANGNFRAIEDLMSVSGIGQKTFDGLSDLVTI